MLVPFNPLVHGLTDTDGDVAAKQILFGCGGGSEEEWFVKKWWSAELMKKWWSAVLVKKWWSAVLVKK